MAKCQYKIGFLTLRDCSNNSIDNCTSCNRPVCDEHKRLLNEKTLCIECFIKQSPEASNESEKYKRAVIYNSVGYHPIYFGHHHGFGNDSYTYFDSTTTTGISQESITNNSEDNIEAGDFQDS
jgi:hypothetical protein